MGLMFWCVLLCDFFCFFFLILICFCLFACWFSDENDRKGVCLSGGENPEIVGEGNCD